MVLTGWLLAFEGIDGAGKTTQIERAAERLRASAPGRELLVLREPGGTEVGEAVRRVLLDGAPRGARAEMLLYLAARAELYERVILPALARGARVLVDRSNYSTAAYQGAGLGLDVDAILDLGRQVTGGRAPDRVVLLRVPPELAAARRSGRADDRIEARGPAYFARVAAAYDRFAAAEPGRFRVVDGTRPPERVAADVAAALSDAG